MRTPQRARRPRYVGLSQPQTATLGIAQGRHKACPYPDGMCGFTKYSTTAVTIRLAKAKGIIQRQPTFMS
jgi:hypothetical protein